MKRRAATTDLPFTLARGRGATRAGLYAALRDAMIDGRLRAGTRLPSTRDLAEQLGVARGTVVEAFAQLAAEGYVESRVGSGTRVSAHMPDAPGIARPEPRRPTAVPPAAPPRLSRWIRQLGTSPFPTSPSPGPARAFRAHVPALDRFPIEVWNRLLARRVHRSSLAMLGDSDPRGHAPLREALAGHLRLARGVRVEPAQLFIVQSTQQAVHLAARVLCDPGEGAWIEDPHYVGALVALRAAGVRPVPVDVDDDGMDVGWAARHAAPARLVYVTPAHQAPTGVTMTLARRLALLEHAARERMVVFEDDYDSEFRHEGHPVPALQAHDRAGVVVHSGSFSKTLFPGLRLGYLVVPVSMIDAFIAARSIEDRYSPVLAQAALADFIGEGHFARHLRRMRQLYRARRAVLLEALAAECGDQLVPIGAPAGLELVVRFGGAGTAADVDDVAVEAALAERGVQAQALSTLSLRRRPPRGLILGFAAVPGRRLRAAVGVLAEVLRSVR